MYETELFGIPKLDSYLIIGILLSFILLETIAGAWNRSKRGKSDWIQEVGAYAVLALLIKPAILLSVLWFGDNYLRTVQYSLAESTLWFTLPVFLLVDDLLQYWYHRIAHEHPFLWKLHRPHHQAVEMGFFVSYRNAGLYYILMPNIWWIGIFTFLGCAEAVAIGLVLKQLVIISSHSLVKYDTVLYKYGFLNPVATVLERIIVTPAFHHAHHGKSKIDRVSDPNANFGNMFSLWDQFFGTAVYTRQFPKVYGLPNDPKEHWSAAFGYPLIRSENPKSELSSGFRKLSTKSAEPARIQLNEGQSYLWCQCGFSKSQPFCDGSHHGTKFSPKLFTTKRDKTVKLCNCKMTKTGPFCDNSHVNFEL